MAEQHSDWMQRLQQRYLGLLQWAETRRKRIIATTVGLLAMTLLLVPLLGSDFLPKLDEGDTGSASACRRRLHWTRPRTSNARCARYRLLCRGEQYCHQVGRPDDGTDPKGPNSMEIMADLKPHDAWRFADKEAMIANMTRRIHDPWRADQFLPGDRRQRGRGAVRREGRDRGENIWVSTWEILEDKAQQVAGILAGIRGAANVAAIKVGGQTELNIRLDRGRGTLGLNINDVNATIQTALAGSAVNSFYQGDRIFDVTLRIAGPYRDAVDDVANLPIALPGGAGTLPLGEIADIEVRQGAARIGREAGSRMVAVKANLLGRDQGSFVDEAMARVGAQVKLPPGYSISWGGQFENQQRAVKRLKVIVPLSILMIFVLLFWAFGSMRKALLVILMVPFTLIGGIAGLGLAGLHLSVSAAVGFIAVAGISVQNGVIIVSSSWKSCATGKACVKA